MTKQPRKKVKGWYVEIDPELVIAFDNAFPAKGAKKILTIAAIRQALKLSPILEVERERLRNEGRRLEGDNAESTGVQTDATKRSGSDGIVPGADQ